MLRLFACVCSGGMRSGLQEHQDGNQHIALVEQMRQEIRGNPVSDSGMCRTSSNYLLFLQVTSLVGRHAGVLFDFCAYEGADAGVSVTALSCDAYIYASS